MRQNTHLRFMQIDRSEIVRQPDGWRMWARLTGWRGRLARLLWQALERLGALEPFVYKETICTYAKPQQDELTELFYQQIDEITDRGGDLRDYCFIIGGEDFSHIVRDYYDLSARGLVVPLGNICHQTAGGYRANYAGLPVHVVGWLKGVAIIPKVIVEVRKTET